MQSRRERPANLAETRISPAPLLNKCSDPNSTPCSWWHLFLYWGPKGRPGVDTCHRSIARWARPRNYLCITSRQQMYWLWCCGKWGARAVKGDMHILKYSAAPRAIALRQMWALFPYTRTYTCAAAHSAKKPTTARAPLCIHHRIWNE